MKRVKSMFTESSKYYDAIYSFKDYKKESAEIIEILKNKTPGARQILDVGCGTAEHHRYLIDHFHLSGIDLNKTFIEMASEKFPANSYTVADMSGFKLNRSFDVILCLFSSIGYLNDVEGLISTFKCFHDHLHPHGLVIIEPWFTPGNYHGREVRMLNCEKDDYKICRMSHSYPQNDVSVLHFHYMIGHKQEGVSYFNETHYLKMFKQEDFLSAFEKTGFEAEFVETGLSGRGIYYARKK